MALVILSFLCGIVKLHSELKIITQLPLVGVGDDFVFPLEEGRKKKEGKTNPHLAFSTRNDPTCLIFGDCLVGVWRVYENCLEGVWRVSGSPLAVLRVPGRCLKGVARESM